MRLITSDDFRDVYAKAVQRGWAFILSKLNPDALQRTKSAFDSADIEASNWWIVPAVRRRWNHLITGNTDKTYEEYLSETEFKDFPSLHLVSIGSGVCSHELRLAQLNPDWKVECIDISGNLLDKARQTAEEKGLKNISFLKENIYTFPIPPAYCDAVLFHSSLHHFKNIDTFLQGKILPILKPGGKLIVHEYAGPNRLQYGRKQRKAINECLQLIDKKFRRVFKTRLYKKHYSGPGLLRMVIADPSECVDSKSIRPAVHKYFTTITEKNLGGNILMGALKDIAHHFVENSEETQETLERLFTFEDNYLKNTPGDFIFGVYEKK